MAPEVVPGSPTPTRRSCSCTAGQAPSRPTSSSSGRRCAGPPASSASTSAVTAARMTRRRRSGCTRSRMSPAPWPGSASAGSGAWRSSDRRWAGSSRSPRSSCSVTARWPRPTSTRRRRPRPSRRRGRGSSRSSPSPSRRTCGSRSRTGCPCRSAACSGGRSPGGCSRLAGRRVGGDLRATEPGRIVGPGRAASPLLLIHGAADRTVRPADGRRLAALAGPVGRALGGARRRPRPSTRGGPRAMGRTGDAISSVWPSPRRAKWCL